MPEYVLKLFISGRVGRSQLAVQNLHRLCEEALPGRYDLEVIDVLEEPQRAEDHLILATPTVLREAPPPARRIIGDLSDPGRVLLGLDLGPAAGPPPGLRAEPGAGPRPPGDGDNE